MFLIKTLCYQLVKNSSFVNCNTLLVTPEKLVPPCGFGRYPSNQYFRHTEAQPHTSLTKRVLMLQFLLIQFYTVYENTSFITSCMSLYEIAVENILSVLRQVWCAPRSKLSWDRRGRKIELCHPLVIFVQIKGLSVPSIA